MHTLTTARLTLRPAHVEDLPTLRAIITADGVAEWWGEYEGSEDDDELVSGYVIVQNDQTIGWIGCDEVSDPKYPSVGLDIVLGPAHQGQGYGPEALRAVIDLYAAKGHHRFTIDPSAANARAIRAYEKAGFRPIGIARRYEQLTAGNWSDGLLMDLIVGDLA
ncbi:MAG: GNAT family N-acetyltransferase [Thermoleophilaceae bacterium]|nr:GNAT family N-acetyltransferase [Thermoleophilaceae bacterium]